MKIFGLEIGNTKLKSPLIVKEENLQRINKDASPTIRPEVKGVTIPEAKKPANIQLIKPRTLSYNTTASRRGQFSEPEYDLGIIGRIEDTDSYVMQAHMKKTGLMFKEGYEFVGSNPKTVDYINLRFQQMARATGVPFDELLQSVGSGLIKKSNVLLVKARKEIASGGRTRTVPGTNRVLEPIAGYFVAPAETMKYDADDYGRVRRWKQVMPDGSTKFFKPEDVVHFYSNRKEGMIFGTPVLVPVIDDIVALRKIEENIELLVYQHLFPLFHYQVGTDDFPASVTEYGEDEIELARREIQYMPAEGGVVTSHRHQISLIGAENRSLRAEGYLTHFKKRVFSGIGLSAVDMGEGECYDEHTQTLTEDGWRFHWQIDHAQKKVGTYNPDTRRIEFHIPNHKYEAPYIGEMLHFKNKYVDIQVTPSHDMWVWHNTTHIWKKMSALDILNGKAGTKCMLMETAPYLDLTDEEDWPSDINELAAVAGLVASAGICHNNKITLTKRTISDFNSYLPLLDSLKIQWKVLSDKHGSAAIEISSYEHGEFFKIKDALAFCKKLPLIARKSFVSHYVKHLGQRREGSYVTAFTDSRERDAYQEIVMSAGYSAYSKKKMIEGEEVLLVKVSLKEKNLRARYVEVARDVKRINYQGIIYCYNVPNHLFVTRRNGLVTIQGNTANRATSDNMSRNLVDSVKDLQRRVEAQFTEFVINELLLESTFGSEVLNKENRVFLKFKEIDLDHQIKKEAHYADQFAKNVISIHEARTGTGRHAFPLPTPEEVESGKDLAAQFPDWYATYWKLIDEPKALIQSIDEPYSQAAKAAAQSRSTEVTETQRQEAGQEQEDRDIRLEKEKAKAKPKPAAPAARKRDSLRRKFNLLQSDTESTILNNHFDIHWFRQLAYATETAMFSELKSRSMAAFADGYRTVNPNKKSQIAATMRGRVKIESRVNFYVHRLIENTIQAVDRQRIDVLANDDRIQRVKAVFDALKYRNDFIEDVEISKARNLGMIEAARDLGYTHFKLVVDDDSCPRCKIVADSLIAISDGLDLEDIPPLHANSRTQIEFIKGM